MGFLFLFAFLLAAFTGLDLYFYFSWKRYVKSMNWHRAWAYIVLIMLILASLSLILLVVNGNIKFLSVIFERILLVYISLWYLPKLVIIPVIFIKDIIVAAYKRIKNRKFSRSNDIVASKGVAETAENISEVSLKRRKILKTAGWTAAIVPFATVANGAIRTTYNYKIYRIEIPINNLPFALDNLKIVQISDIHSGSFVSDKQIREVRTIINTLQPDILFITGDFVNNSPNEFPLIAEHLSAMEARLGKFAILGNHDHYMSEENHQKLIQNIKNCGFDLLINENRSLNINDTKLQIAGVDDLSFHNHFGNFDVALSGLSDGYVTILLCHDPTQWDNIKGKRHVELTLSGHTHGGQYGIDMFGRVISASSFIYKYNAGLYENKDQFLYVNRGIGTTGPPIRVGVNPEVSYIILKRFVSIT